MNSIKKAVLNSWMKIVRKNYPDYDEDKLFEIRYGLEGVYLSLTKVVVILGIAFLLGIFKEAIIILALFNVLRFAGFGIHASKSWMCWVSSSIVFIGFPLICKYMYIPQLASIIISILCVITFMLYAPADTYKRPLIKQKKRLLYKISTVLLSLVFVYFAFKTSNQFVHNALLSAMLIESVLIHPVTYKIFKLPYNNYKTYVMSTDQKIV